MHILVYEYSTPVVLRRSGRGESNPLGDGWKAPPNTKSPAHWRRGRESNPHNADQRFPDPKSGALPFGHPSKF